MSGYLNNGVWQVDAPTQNNACGEFVRIESQFRDWISADGSTGYKAENGRYHLYVSLACPWAHRTLISRALNNLTDVISVSVVDPVTSEDGWVFSDYPGSTEDHVYGFRTLHALYALSQMDYTGFVTVPVLWDKYTSRIVNNESSEIIQMLNNAFGNHQNHSGSSNPEPLRSELDIINEFVYENINNGVYRCGFATTQTAYEQAINQLFGALAIVEEELSKHRYLIGNSLSEADIRLFPTLVRFDPVYFFHFKCCLQRLADFPNLSGYLRDIYQIPGVSETVNIDHIKRHYYLSHPNLNPMKIIPVGAAFDLSSSHNRARLL